MGKLQQHIDGVKFGELWLKARWRECSPFIMKEMGKSLWQYMGLQHKKGRGWQQVYILWYGEMHRCKRGICPFTTSGRCDSQYLQPWTKSMVLQPGQQTPQPSAQTQYCTWSPVPILQVSSIYGKHREMLTVQRRCLFCLTEKMGPCIWSEGCNQTEQQVSSKGEGQWNKLTKQHWMHLVNVRNKDG